MREPQAVVGLTPFEHPDVGLAVALARAGALAVLDLGHDAGAAREALQRASRRVTTPFGVRIPEHLDTGSIELPPNVQLVMVPASLRRFAWDGREVLAQVTSIEEARVATAGGAHGLVVKGQEAGGVVGDETAFVLLQRVLAETALPVWVQGGIGLHTAAACVAAGARGVVLDAQLALLEEARTGEPLRRAIASMDGSETVIAAGYRLYARPNARAPQEGASGEEIARSLGATDPTRHLVALGQDAAFAKTFADRCGTVERVVRALHSAMAGHVRQARALRPLARSSPLATELGTTFPIVQGPMTRVSDKAAFADAVARGGGLPFLALSLMRRAEAAELLAETRARLGDRSWGVGILGFSPPEIRDEHLALLKEVRPRVVLIAGGRPSQAEPLEQAGIKTFLHVPSPGLLDMFLKEGARRFVFEGRECGGHVGPRSSFVLWEAAVERLLARESLADVSVLFAGGVHDALSARMVATLAAPLSARGAKVGVLMGTAYLFTEEAVACGAIGAAFQDAALGCESTALVETAPGHATRCAESDFVRAFERERARLEAAEPDAQARWAALEQYNLGRLRIASKGLRRDGDGLVTVAADEQSREGMFMIGQVAALRSARCTIDALHRDVSDASTATLDRIAVPPPPASRERAAVDVAIVGMACVFPGATDVGAYWTNVVLGRGAVREVPGERWTAERHYDPKGTGDKTPSKWGGFVPPTLFDPGAFGIPPRSMAAIDPVQILSLAVAQRALEDAGYADRPFDRERTSVVFGAEGGTDLANAYGFRACFGQLVGDMPKALDEAVPRLTEDSFPGVLANVIAGRIANRLDLRGVNYTVDAACASSLAAVDAACKELASGTSDMVLAGGADLHNGIHDYLMFASVHALSPTGQCRPFDAKADGIALGEGVAAVVLKRLEDAERDGDRVYAVIRGIAGSSDGKSLGLTAPRKEGQLRALERAYARAGVSPADVELVEAHGTGTVVGDRTELAALTDFFGAAGATAATCTLGSVKAQIGHTKCAAGMAGLIKVALAVHHGVLPPTRNVTAPNPGYDAPTSPFVLRDGAAPWTSATRVGAVSAFGFGGTNFHAVVSSPASPPADVGLSEWPAELFVVRGESRDAALRVLAQVDALLGADAPPRLRDLAWATARANAGARPVFAIVASTPDQLRASIAAVREGRGAEGVHEVAAAGGDVAFLFPGQGSQRPQMLADLFVAFPALRALLERAGAPAGRLFPGGAFTPQDRVAQQAAITDTRIAQPMLGVADLAVARLLAKVGVRPQMAAGHSYGELVALAVAGALDDATLLALSRARAECILDAAAGAPGTMAAVRASKDAVETALGEGAGVVVANHNAPDQVVIAGPDAAVAEACERLAAAGLSARTIPVACAFHSPVVAGARDAFAERLAGAEVHAPNMPVYANSSAKPYAHSADAVRRGLSEQIALPVRFVEQIEAMYAAGARVFVEAGPGGVLTDLVGRILRGRDHVAIACDRSGAPGLPSFLSALARLVAAGVGIDLEPLFAGRAALIDLAAPERFAAPPTAWVVDGGHARPLRGELPAFAMRPIAAPIPLAAAASDDREQVVREYLRTMRELVDGQRQVMLRYLGAQAEEPRVTAAVAAAAPRASVEAAPKAAAAERPTPLAAVVATVCERTGYPEDMLDPDLDLEADLGIDSIKRIEILGAVRDKLGLQVSGQGQNALVEQLSGVKTLRGIVDILEQRLRGDADTPAAAAKEATAAPPPEPPPPSGPPSRVERYVVDVDPVAPPTPSGVALAGRTFAITRDAYGVAQHLADTLARHGAHVRVVGQGEPIGQVDGLIHLATLGAGSPDAVHELFTRAREAASASTRWIVAATGLGGRFGLGPRRGAPPVAAGVSGFLKSLKKEHPELAVRAIDVDPSEGGERLAEYLHRELVADDGHIEVGYVAGERHTVVVAPRPSSTPPPVPLAIDRSSVVLLTGGARGITAIVALAMARRFGCKLELVGRSPLPDDEEDGELRAALDAPSLRRALVARMNGAGPASPAAIEAQVRSILGAREIRATLAAIRDAGSRVAYHAVDVRDEAAFGALLDALRAKHGRIDGVVHGAGLIEDKLLRDKTLESFDRVFSTKVAGARTLALKLADEARFFVLFSSISGAFGNRGQTDYAAANDALDKLAHHLHRTVRGRVLSINWGPWRGAGMVRPELEREYERRGIGLIAPDAGIERFFEELLAGSDPQVILTAASAAAWQ
jgi:acyl transferase domain-containing protein/NAD(P)H-dependent flavin oxidoreductase YrpB (nitropropane dioxygenase family)/short-subunit dehydrogenase